MPTYSFRSAGKTREQKKIEELTKSPTPIGIKTPLRLGTDHIFEVTYSLADQVHDNLRNLILTNWGERLGLYDFGANLRPLTTEFVSQTDFDSQAIERISKAVNRWMPYVVLDTFESSVDRTSNTHTAIITITVVYSVPSLNVSTRGLAVTLYVI